MRIAEKNWLLSCGIGIALLLSSTKVLPQVQIPSPQQPAPSSVGWLEGWRQATLSFGTVEKDDLQGDYYKVVGSGIVISTGPSTAYIITAKHVFFDPDKKWHPSEIRIRYGWQDQKSVYAEHGIPLKLRDHTGKDLWTALPDDTDLAGILAPPPIIASQPSVGAVSIANPDEVFEGESIIVLGYPGIVGNEYLVRAISRGGIVAWLNPKDPLKGQFLVDSNIYPGNSGGPVIKVPTGVTKEGGLALGGRAALLGIVIQTPGQSGEFDLKVPGQSRPLRIHQEIPLGGTGVAEPATKITKLLDLLKSQ